MTLIRGNNRPVPTGAALSAAQKVNAQLNYDIHNRFDISVIDAATGAVKQRAQAQNVICNQLWTQLFAPAAYFNYIHYGTGTGTPAATDTRLFTFLGYGTPATNDDIYDKSDINGYVSLTRKIQISENTAVGYSLSEVGLGYGGGETTLLTHAMLKDMNGNTITILKNATDIINIYATIFVQWQPSKYDNGYVEFYPITHRPGNYFSSSITSWLLGMSRINWDNMYAWFASGNDSREKHYANAIGIRKERVSSVSSTCNPSNKTISLSVTRIPVANCNIAGGIGCVEIGACELSSNSFMYCCPAGEIILRVGGSWYMGTTIAGESVATGDGTTKDFETNYVMLSDAIIKVNGVTEASGVKVDKNIPSNLNSMGRNFVLMSLTNRDGISSPWGVNFRACGVDEPDGNNPFYGNSAVAVYYNPFYTLGILSFEIANNMKNASIAVSDDGLSWKTLSSNAPINSVISVPIEYQYYRYWKIWNPTDSDTAGIRKIICKHANAHNIHFTTPPAAGAVITADYTTKTIAKDANHVFDLTVTITLGEKTV